MATDEQPKRDLTAQERNILQKLLSVEFPGRAEIKEQLRVCKAVSTGDVDNYGSIYLATDSSNKAVVITRIPVEAVFNDADGGSVEILLHVVDGLVNELEIFKSDGSKMLSPTIDADKLRVKVNK